MAARRVMTRCDVATVGAFLDDFYTLTLATQGADGPWAASLFFVRDRHLNLYFLSSRRARHVDHLLAWPGVALTVNADQADWNSIRGLQISGSAELVAEQDRKRVSELYLRKFEQVRQIVLAPSSETEKTIADRFRTSKFFRIRPKLIRMIDNAEGLGHKVEYILEA